MNWGFHIRRLREAKRLSQTDLAQLSGLTRTHISNIERGRYITYKPETLKKLAFGLEISIDALNREIFGTEKAKETFEQILERLKIAIPSTVPIYEEFPHQPGNLVEAVDFASIVRERAKGRILEGYIVHGASLEPDIREGDIIIVDREGQLDNGDIVACLYQEHILLGRVRKIADELYVETSKDRIKLDECPIAFPVVEIRRRLR